MSDTRSVTYRTLLCVATVTKKTSFEKKLDELEIEFWRNLRAKAVDSFDSFLLQSKLLHAVTVHEANKFFDRAFPI